MKKMMSGMIAALIVVLGLAVAPTAAQAHTGDMSVTAVCNTATGQYDLTATLTTANTRLAGQTQWRVGSERFEGTPSSNSGMTSGPVASQGAQTITLGSFSLPGSTIGHGPWVYAFTTWTDGFTKGSDGQLLQPLAGDCKIPEPPEPAPVTGTETRENGVCVEPLNGTLLTTYEARDWTQGWVWDKVSWTWVPAEAIYGEWYVSGTETSDAEGCIPAPPAPLSGEESEAGEPICVEPLDGTATITTLGRTWSQEPVWNQEAGEWQYAERVYTDWAEIDQNVIDLEECIPPAPPAPPVPNTPVLQPDPEPKSAPQELAVTGSDSEVMPWIVASFAGAVGILGIILIIGAALSRKKI